VKTPIAMKKGFTTSVPAQAKNFPTINSQRRTGRDRTVYKGSFFDFLGYQSNAHENRDHHSK